MAWPLQSECDAFYGNPRGINGHPSKSWMQANLTRVTPLFRMTYAGQPVKSITIHRKCADSLQRVLDAVWTSSGHNQVLIDSWGMSIFGGSFNYRLMRGLNRLSMHSYGCAIDFDPARNGLGDTTPWLKECPLVLDAFAQEGWVWGGKWSRPDGMHFQAARVA